MTTQKKKILFIAFLQCAIFIVGCGTLDGFEERHFPISRKKLEMAIDSLYSKYPDYRISKKWEVFNDWSKRGYDFLESRVFYFKSSPEEMYYVTFIGDSTALADTSNCNIAIRAVFKENTKRWLLQDDFDSKEKQRIEMRFNNEIISKLEQFTQTEASTK